MQPMLSPSTTWKLYLGIAILCGFAVVMNVVAALYDDDVGGVRWVRVVAAIAMAGSAVTWGFKAGQSHVVREGASRPPGA